MALLGWLIDASALFRIGASPDAAMWTARTQRGLIRIATVTRLEIGYSARSGADLRDERARPPLTLLPVEHLTPAVEARAEEIQEALGDRGQNRAPSVSDLLVAAAAERAGLTVLHVDKDFDLIAAVTGQPVERLRLTEET